MSWLHSLDLIETLRAVKQAIARENWIPLTWASDRHDTIEFVLRRGAENGPPKVAILLLTETVEAVHWEIQQLYETDSGWEVHDQRRGRVAGPIGAPDIERLLELSTEFKNHRDDHRDLAVAELVTPPGPGRDLAEYSAEEILSAAAILLEPRRWVHRIVESVALNSDRVRRSVSIHLRVPYLGKDSALVPLLLAPRGRLFDNFDATDGADRAIPILSHQAHVRFESLILDGALITALGMEGRAPEGREARSRLLQIPHLPPRAAMDACREVESFLAQNVDEAAAQLVGGLARVFARTYVVLAEAPVSVGPHTIVKYAFDSPIFEEAPHTFTARCRQFIGSSPYTIRLSVPNLKRCDSYHLRMDAPPGHFVAEQEFIAPVAMTSDRMTTREIDRIDFEALGAALEGPNRIGRSYAHLFVAGGDLSSLPTVFARVTFHERPPGSMGSALISTLSLAVVVFALMTLSREDLLERLDSGLNILLAVPGLFAMFQRQVTGAQGLAVRPLCSRAAFALTATLSGLTILGGQLATSESLVGVFQRLLYAELFVLVCASLWLMSRIRGNQLVIRMGLHGRMSNVIRRSSE